MCRFWYYTKKIVWWIRCDVSAWSFLINRNLGRFAITNIFVLNFYMLHFYNTRKRDNFFTPNGMLHHSNAFSFSPKDNTSSTARPMEEARRWWTCTLSSGTRWSTRPSNSTTPRPRPAHSSTDLTGLLLRLLELRPRKGLFGPSAMLIVVLMSTQVPRQSAAKARTLFSLEIVLEYMSPLRMIFWH